MDTYADIIFREGIIYTVNKENNWAEAIAVKDNKIVYVGDSEGSKKYEGDFTKVINLEKKMVLPGFIDSHAHPLKGEVQLLYEVNLYDEESLEGYLKKVKDFYDKNPDIKFILGVGWLNTVFGNKGPKAVDLDKITKDIPIILNSGDYHSVWVNSKAMEISNVTQTTPDVEGGVIERYENGEPSGTFRETAQDLVKAIIPEHTVEEYRMSLKSFQKNMAALGITLSYEAMLDPNSNMYKAYLESYKNNEMIIKMRGAFTALPNDPKKDIKIYENNIPEENGDKFQVNHIKFFIDGVVEGNTAYLKKPYANKPGYVGELVWEDIPIKALAKMVDKMGYDFHFHVIGDGAIDTMLTILEEVTSKNGKKNRRPIAAHMQIFDINDLDRLIEQNVVISANPAWFYKDPGYFYNIELPYLGEERANKEYPMKTFIKNNIVTASGSDYPITMPPDPLSAIQIAVTRCMPGEDHTDIEKVLAPEERVSLEDMIESFTLSGAYANRLENVTGSLEVGKLADIVILEKNLFDIPVNRISEVKIMATLSEGELIYTSEDFDIEPATI